MNKRFLSIGLTALSILMLTLSTVQMRGNVAAASPRPQTVTLANSQSQNQNNLPYPKWWNGTPCDTKIVSNSAPLGTYYRGMPACGPIGLPADSSHEVVFPGGFGEYEWQCVELSMRFMYLAYGINAYNANGNEVVDHYTNSTYDPGNYNNPILRPVTNDGSSKSVPQAGDILSYKATVSFGHTSVVTASNVDSSGNGTITVIEQNSSPTGQYVLKVGAKANKPPWVIGSGIKNWLRHTLDVSPQVAPSGSVVTISGTGFGANEQVVLKLGGTQIGTATAGGSGSFSTIVTIPHSLSSNTYTLTASGQSSGFSPRMVFYVKGQVAGGKLVWRYQTGGQVYSSPAVANGVVYVGSTDGYVYALNASSGTLLWRYQTEWNSQLGNIVYSSPAVANGVVYVGSYDGYVYALNASTGTLLWRYQTGWQVYSSPTVVNGVVYIGSHDDYVYALNASTGSLLWRYQTGNWIDSLPMVVNGVVYIGSEDSYVYALNASSGTLLWRYQTGASVESSPAVVNGVVYIGSQNDYVYALNANNGTLLWSYQTGGQVYSSPAVINGVVYVGATDYYVYALNANNGSLLWRYQTGYAVVSSPTVVNGVVCIGSDDDYVYALNASTGTLLWRYQTGNGIESSPAVVNGLVYVGSDDGYVYAITV